MENGKWKMENGEGAINAGSSCNVAMADLMKGTSRLTPASDAIL
jgi:hypothetical protein